MRAAGVDAKREGIWNAGRKKTIEDRFVRTGLPYAQSNWDTVRARMDVLSDSWAAAERAMCRTAEEDVPVGYGRRMACLHRRYEELRSYSDLLAEADAGLVEHAVTTVEALGTVGDCEDESPGMRSDIPGEAQREITAALARTRVLGQAGRYDAAVEAANDARRAAEAVDERWLAAEATFELGKVTESTGRIEDAERIYDDAFSAGIAAGHDEVVARAAMSVAVLELDHDKDFEAAANWMEHAGGAVERIGPAGRGHAAGARERARTDRPRPGRLRAGSRGVPARSRAQVVDVRRGCAPARELSRQPGPRPGQPRALRRGGGQHEAGAGARRTGVQPGPSAGRGHADVAVQRAAGYRGDPGGGRGVHAERVGAARGGR